MGSKLVGLSHLLSLASLFNLQYVTHLLVSTRKEALPSLWLIVREKHTDMGNGTDWVNIYPLKISVQDIHCIGDKHQVPNLFLDESLAPTPTQLVGWSVRY